MATKSNRTVEKVVQFDDILERRFATAPIEWIDEQLRESGLDHAPALRNVQAIIARSSTEPVRREKRHWVRQGVVAAAILAGLILLPTRPASRYERPTAGLERIASTHHATWLLVRGYSLHIDLASVLFADRPELPADPFALFAASAWHLLQYREEHGSSQYENRRSEDIDSRQCELEYVGLAQSTSRLQTGKPVITTFGIVDKTSEPTKRAQLFGPDAA